MAATTTNPAARPAIEARGLTKRYGRIAALADVGFAIAPGEALALWGPNGAGKTTILRCLLGLARYDGEVRVEGIDPRRDGRAVRGAIGYLPQDLPVSPATVGETVAFVARLKRAPLGPALLQVDRLGIGEQVDKKVSALSGGMRQRLALALALIGAPRILLLDEPTANLDAAGRASVLDLLRDLKRRGMTLLFSSHRPEDVLALADRVVLIEHGVVRRDAGPAEFRDELSAVSSLVLTLSNGHLHEAIATLDELGFAATGEGHVLTVPVAPGQKAHVLGALARGGIDVADFDLERRA
jgi:ABC-type multidrug transport system ATPase subunit